MKAIICYFKRKSKKREIEIIKIFTELFIIMFI